MANLNDSTLGYYDRRNEHILLTSINRLSLLNSDVESSVQEALRPSLKLRRLVDTIDSMLAFCNYLATMPPYLLRGKYHISRTNHPELTREVHSSLGVGASFEVVSTKIDTDPETSQCVAIKTPVAKGVGTPEEKKTWMIQSLRAIAWELHCLTHKPVQSSKNIAKYLGVVWKPSFTGFGPDIQLMPALVMEEADLGTLNDLFHMGDENVPLQLKRKLAADVARGMHLLHTNNIIHGDLKAQNILVFSDKEEGIIAKVADFGLGLHDVSWKGDELVRLKGSTPPWDAPEITRGHLTLTGLPSIDIYAYGLLIWRMILNGRTPFDGRIYAQQVDGFQDLLKQDHNYFASIAEMKQTGDAFLDRILISLDKLQMSLEWVEQVLRATIRLEPERRIGSFGTLLGLTGENDTTLAPNSKAPKDKVRWGNLTLSEEIQKYLNFDSTTRDHTVLDLSNTEALVPNLVRQQIYRELLVEASEGRMNCLFNLAMCHFLGFGTEMDHHTGVQVMFNAACAGHIGAKALVGRLAKACGEALPSDYPAIDWLSEAASMGSIHAAQDLFLESPERYNVAMKAQRNLMKYGQMRKHLDMGKMADFEVRYDSPDSIRSWLQRNPSSNVDALEYFTFTALHCAAMSGNCSLIEYLVEQGASLDPKNLMLETPLLCAIHGGQAEAAATLLRHGADPRIENLVGATAMHYLICLERKHVQRVLELLLESGANIDATSPGSIHVLSSMQDFICEPRTFWGTPLHWATAARRIDIVKELLHRGANPLKDPTAVGDEITQSLFEISSEKALPLRIAALNADRDIFTHLLNASSSGQITSQQSLLSSVIGVTHLATQTDFGYMCLHGRSYKEMVGQTISLLGDGNGAGNDFGNLMTHTATGPCTGLLDYLIEHGADVNLPDPKNDFTPLQWACSISIPGQMALKLLKYGADPLKQTDRVAGSCLPLLASHDMAQLTLPLVEQIIRRCKYSDNPVSYRLLYQKAIRYNDQNMAKLILAQPDVEQKTLETGLLKSLLMDNTFSSIHSIEALVQREPPSIIVDVARQYTAFHFLALIREKDRNEDLNERLTRFLISTYRPEKKILDLPSSTGWTAMALAVVSGNWRLLQCLLENEASLTAGKFAVPLALVDRISRLLDAPRDESGGIATEFKRNCLISRMTRNTVHFMRSILAHLPESKDVKHLRGNDGIDLISRVVKKWRQPTNYLASAKATIGSLLGNDATVRQESATSIAIVEGTTGEPRKLSYDEMKKVLESIWAEMLSELIAPELLAQ